MSSNVQEMRRDVRELLNDLKQLEREVTLTISAVYGMAGILRKMGLGETADAALTKLMQLVASINMVRTALHALQIAYVGAGPVGWVLAGIGAIGAMATVGGMIEDAGWDLHRHGMSW